MVTDMLQWRLPMARGGYTMKTIAAYFGVHYSTVSRAVCASESQTADAPTASETQAECATPYIVMQDLIII